MSISKAVIMGKVIRNPEKRFTSNNVPITYFAINFGKDAEASVLRVIAKGKLAESVADTVKKDQTVIVEGRLQTNTVKGDSGTEKKVIELDARSVEPVSPPVSSGSEPQEEIDFGDDAIIDDLIGEDEIPF